MPHLIDLPGLAEMVQELRRQQPERRILVGIAGAPGAGKSTVAQELTVALGFRAQLLPMDGFHLAQQQLERLGRAERKGAPDTFDVAGFLSILDRVRADDGTVFAPIFDRGLEEPIAGAIAIEPAHRCVVVEGNYLLHDDGGWQGVLPLLDECWFLDLPDDVRVERLVRRHIEFGRSPDAARAWVEQVDEANARLIEEGRGRASAVVRVLTRSDASA